MFVHTDAMKNIRISVVPVIAVSSDATRESD